MRIRLILLLVLFTSVSFSNFAQNIEFEAVLPPPPEPQNFASFNGVEDGSSKFIDVDNDGYQDLLITGINDNVEFITKLYLNDGKGNFYLDPNTPFPGIRRGSISFSDIDNDNDMDLLLTGESGNTSGAIPITILYENDGGGNFIELDNTSFPAVSESSTLFVDIDNDQDQDLIITGLDSNNIYISEMYTNNGLGIFTKAEDTLFSGVKGGSISYSDVENDNDIDILITGQLSWGNMTTELYLNDGNGDFKKDSNLRFIGLGYGSSLFADIDGDNDEDLIVVGLTEGGGEKSLLYLNDGNGLFTESLDTKLGDFFRGSIGIADVDADDDLEIIIAGGGVTKLYDNNGSGIFSESIISSFKGVTRGSVAIADVDNDNDDDILITGNIGTLSFPRRTAILYINDGRGSYQPVNNTSFEGVGWGYSSVADVDNDNDLDILVNGISGGVVNTKLYLNDGLGNFTDDTNLSIRATRDGALAFCDVDNDNDQDIFISGTTNNGAFCALYINDGRGNFTRDYRSYFHEVDESSVVFADIDNDGDSDLFTSGSNSGNLISVIYLNDGTGYFEEDPHNQIIGVYRSSAVFADFNNDNYLDLFVTGDSSPDQIAQLYINDKRGILNKDNRSSFNGVINSSVAVADIDADSDIDILIAGRSGINDRITNLYTNRGSGIFALQSTIISGIGYGAVEFADIDNDNDQDLLITGQSSADEPVTELYSNDGKGSFTLVTKMPFVPVWRSSLSIADFDMDKDLDILITGLSSASAEQANIYRNVSCIVEGLDKTVKRNEMTLSVDVTDATFQWLDCDNGNEPILGATTQSFEADNNHSYAIEITKNGCQYISSCYDVFVVGLIDPSASIGLGLFPNPSRSEVKINLMDSSEDYIINVRDMDGRLVNYKHSLDGNIITLIINGINGIYLVEVITDDEKSFFKVIKE